MKTLLSAGEFADLARTTKRTILWYDKKGILEPHKIEENGYRYYLPRQIIDFQVISLLRQLDFSISDIKKFLKDSKSLQGLFRDKREVISNELKKMRLKLDLIEEYYRNLSRRRLLVRPKIKLVEQHTVICMDVQGRYSKIKEYCLDLEEIIGKRLAKKGKFYTAFYEKAYRPKNAKMQIGLMIGREERKAVEQLLNNSKAFVGLHLDTIPSHKALVHTHKGSGRFNSLLWNHLTTFMRRKKLKAHPDIPHKEIYLRTSLNGYPDEDEHVFELHKPIRG